MLLAEPIYQLLWDVVLHNNDRLAFVFYQVDVHDHDWIVELRQGRVQLLRGDFGAVD